MRIKVSVIGAGAVGATTAQRILERELADVVLLDVVEGLPQGKALDLRQAGAIEGYQCQIIGSNDYSAIQGSEIVVVTAGLVRKPGMSRDDLQSQNAKIVQSITENIKKYGPDSKILMVTNPLDVMTYLAYKVSGFKANRVFGMAGMLDSARMCTFIAEELKVSAQEVETMVLGTHGDTMVPLIGHTKVKGRPITELLSKEKIDKVVDRTRFGGAEIVNLLKTGSAFYAPSAAVADMVESVIKDQKKLMPTTAYLDGSYGLHGLYLGVPAKLGKNGVEEIVEIKLTDEEKKALLGSAAAVKEQIKKL